MADLVDSFLSQAQSHSEISAVSDASGETSYEALAIFADRIAGAIVQTASTSCPRVLLAIPASVAAYAGMIGTLRAGGTFCPVNMDGPESRNALISRSFSPDIILFNNTPSSFFDELPATTPRVDVSRLESQPITERIAEFSEIAYVVFTSGSTGQPKGVKIGRAAFSCFLARAKDYFSLRLGERWGQFSNLGYDLAVMDVFMALTEGGTLVPLVNRKDRLMPAAAIKERNIEIWQSVPSVVELMFGANQITADHLASLRIMSFCGEPLLPRHVKALFAAKPDLQVFNTYGATETIGFNTINRLTAENHLASCEGSTVALGEDVPGWSLSLRNGDNPNEGEIVVSSESLSLGYWGDEDRTRNAFRQLWIDGEQRRCYLTGDCGVRRDGRLYFTSRRDRQIKIKGERIELDEIDYFLRESGFRSAYTILKGDDLHSFVEAANGVDADLVRAHLKKHLPFHAVPKAIHALPVLPRNSNGKIDRAALASHVS